MEETKLGWALGALSLESLPEAAVLSRRFGLKVRLIDDLSGSFINGTVQTSELPTLQNIDYIGATLLQTFLSESEHDTHI